MKWYLRMGAYMLETPQRRWYSFAGSTYRESLYGARRFPVKQSASQTFHQFNAALRESKVKEETISRRYFVPPGKVANLARMASRRRRFNALFAERVAEVQQIYNQYYSK
jgi:hypothetical protein